MAHLLVSEGEQLLPDPISLTCSTRSHEDLHCLHTTHNTSRYIGNISHEEVRSSPHSPAGEL